MTRKQAGDYLGKSIEFLEVDAVSPSAIRTCILEKAQRQAVANALLPALKASNPNFNAARFINAAVGD